MSQTRSKSLSVIVSVCNEEKVVRRFYESITEVLSRIESFDSQVIFVNDGSRDNSQKIINEIIETHNSPVRLQSIEFSRNYGHEAAMIAGIDNSEDDVMICMDADLQHPPEIIPEMLKSYEEGNDIVLMNRIKRHDNGLIKNLLSSLFYKIIDALSVTKLGQNTSDFFLVSEKVGDVLKNNFRERNRFLRGFIQVIGFDIATLEFESPGRFAGESNYSFKSLSKLGFTAIFAFSNKPLKISLFFAILFFLFSSAVIIYSLIVYFWGTQPPSGYTSLIIFQSIGFTVLSLIISILSIYFGRSLDEIRNRPIYLIKSKKHSST